MRLVSVTRKGQVTIPDDVRRELGIKLGTKLLVDKVGKEYVLMKKIEMTGSMDELQRIGQKIAKKRGLTPEEVQKKIEKIRAELWKERYAKHHAG